MAAARAGSTRAVSIVWRTDADCDVKWSGAIHFSRVATGNAQLIAMEVSTEVAETYNAQVISNLGQIDQTLKIVRHAYTLTDDPGVLGELGEKGLLPSSLLFTVRIANEDGKVIASTRANERGRPIGQEHLDAHRNNGTDTPFVNTAKRHLSSGDPELSFSRKLNAQGERFTGVVTVSVPPVISPAATNTPKWARPVS